MERLKSAFFKALGIGVITLLLSLVVSFFAASDGVRINSDAWPPSAKAILKETPEVPLTHDQWRRIERELHTHGVQEQISHVWAAEIRQTWFVFVALAVIALAFIPRVKPLSPSIAALAITSPNFAALALAFFHVHPYLP